MRLGAVALLLVPFDILRAANESLVQTLKLTRFVEPQFPAAARDSGLADGQVTLALSRTPAGEPVDILVLDATDPVLAVAAVDAARSWRFAPTDDPAELVTPTVRVAFRLQGVVMFPAGKGYQEAAAPRAGSLLVPTKVRALQDLRYPPKLLVQPMPGYPAALTGRRLSGEAAVQFYVDETGRVRLPKVLHATTPEFGEAAVAAVANWRYEPPRNGRRPVIVTEHWAFQFKGAD
jgi:TonB family protein